MSQYALGFDVGLSGVRATVLRDDGSLVASARRPHARARMGDGLAEHDPVDWLDGVQSTGREAVAAAGVRIGALGVSALGPAPVVVDEQLRPLTKALLFGLDRRAEPQRRRMLEQTPAEAAGVTLSGVLPNLEPLPATHAAATLDNALPKLAWWLEQQPEIGERAGWALDATGFVSAALTGVPVMDSITAGDYSLPGTASPFPLPAPQPAVGIAGDLLPEWAERLGLPAGLPVSVGTYDSFADIAAAGVRGPGDAGLVLGSTMIIGRVVESANEPPLGLALSAYPGEGTLMGGWTLSGGLALDWFAQRFGTDESLAHAAAGVEPNGLLALPYLAGERTPLWDPHARGAFIGLSADTGPAELYRALVDSLALAVLDHAERLEAALGPCPSWRVTGGGTGHPFWAQATADALGVPLEIAPDADQAVGPALLALRMVGFDPERRAAATLEPDARGNERLRARLPIFRELSRLITPAVHELAAANPQEGTS